MRYLCNGVAPKKEGSMTEDQGRTPDHLRWLIDCRTQNQNVSLQLYEILKSNPEAGKTREGQHLVAVAFSLWRAAFLADRTGSRQARSKNAEIFLHRMLADNAITYDSREWTFNYYIDNARYRLEELKDLWPGITKSLRPPPGRRVGKAR